MIRKFILFLAGLMLMLLMCGMLYVSGAIYDTAGKATVVPYFFQPDNHFERRPGVPATAEELESDSDENSEMYNRLLERYITEMFYVTPDATELEKRMTGQTALYRMSYGSGAFPKWLDLIAPEIEEMTQQKKLRLVKVLKVEPEEQYMKITYELKTWNESNNLEINPEISYGVVYLNIRYEPGVRKEIGKRTVGQYLEQGGDPAAVFRFAVTDIAVPQE